MRTFEAITILLPTIVVVGFSLWVIARLSKADTARERPAGDPFILNQQMEILGELATLPQFLALKNGGVINLLSGDTVIPSESAHEPPYLALKGTHMGRGILFSTVNSLNKYLLLQRRIAERLSTSDFY